MISVAEVTKLLYGYHCNAMLDSEIIPNLKNQLLKQVGLFMLKSKYLHKNFWSLSGCFYLYRLEGIV
jgi:hypothetical protein